MHRYIPGARPPSVPVPQAKPKGRPRKEYRPPPVELPPPQKRRRQSDEVQQQLENAAAICRQLLEVSASLRDRVQGSGQRARVPDSEGQGSGSETQETQHSSSACCTPRQEASPFGSATGNSNSSNADSSPIEAPTEADGVCGVAEYSHENKCLQAIAEAKQISSSESLGEQQQQICSSESSQDKFGTPTKEELRAQAERAGSNAVYGQLGKEFGKLGLHAFLWRLNTKVGVIASYH